MSKVAGGPAVLAAEFAILDPVKSVRITAIQNAKRALWLETQSTERRLAILQERPLTELEFSQLVVEFQKSPGYTFALLQNKLNAGLHIKSDDIFPASLGYFSALIPVPQSDANVDTWLIGTVVPELQRAIQSSLIDGLKRTFAFIFDLRINPAELVATVPASELLSALNLLIKTMSPITLVGILEIALDHHVQDVGL